MEHMTVKMARTEMPLDAVAFSSSAFRWAASALMLIALISMLFDELVLEDASSSVDESCCAHQCK
jgi:hypothetical protein